MTGISNGTGESLLTTDVERVTSDTPVRTTNLPIVGGAVPAALERRRNLTVSLKHPPPPP